MIGKRPLLIGFALLAACAAPPRRDHDLRITPPEAWTAVEGLRDSDVTGTWWTSFDDPALSEIVALALEQNHDLQAAAARVGQAVERAKVAGAERWPSVNAGLNATRQRQNFVGFPIPGGGGDVLSTTSTRVGASLDVSWEADLWGRLRAQTRAAIADLDATRADYRGGRLSLSGQTAKIWFAVAEASEQVELARRSAESFRGLTEYVRARFEKGVRPALDLRLAISNQASAEAALEARLRQLDASVRQLEVLLGEYPSARLLARFPAGALPETPPPIPTGLPAQLVGRRPDLVAAERRLAAADQRGLSARRALYPRLTLTASGGTVSDQLKDLLDGDFKVWSLAGGLLQPVFQGGRLRAQVRLADASSDQLFEEYAAALLDAFAEVETSLAAEQYLARQEEHLTEAALQFRAAERLSEERYRNGVGGYLDVLDSQTRAFLAQSNLLELRRLRLDNRVDLHLALGGDFASEPTTAATDPASEDDPS